MEHINLELVPRGIERTAHASQYDHGRQIRFDIYNGGTPYTLSGAETITMQVNGQSEAVPNTSDDYIIWTVPDEFCETDGVTECELRIVESGVLIGSKNFFLEVEYDPYGTGVLILSAHGAPAHFETDLSDIAIECKVDIDYNANGYKSALVVNTSNAPSEDSAPYLFRPSYSNGYGYETLIGGTCGVNQLVQNGNFADTSVWQKNGATTTVSYANNKASGTADSVSGGIFQSGIQLYANHKYYYSFDIKNDQTMNCGFSMFSSGRKAITANGTTTKYSFIGTLTADNNNGVFAFYNANTVNLTFEISNVQLIDLTQMFGTAIADYVYTLENS